MKIENRENAAVNIVGAALILIASAGDILSQFSEPVYKIRSILRAVCYLLLFALWIVSLEWRIVQKHIKRCLIAVAALEFLWTLIRLIKFSFLRGADETRYAWYLYYLPILMIPAICLILAVCMGKPETERPNGRLIVFPVISAALFLVVITNDLHSLVFNIPPGIEGLTVGNYTYGAGFAVITAYVGLCAAASYGIILVKCRVPDRKKRRFLPLIPMAAAIIINVLNILGVKSVFGIVNIDITIVTCVCTTAALEACIQSGLILTNSGYEELFRMSGISAVITDENYSALIASDTCGEISPDDMRRAESSPVMPESGLRLSSAPIKHGRVLWQDDLSELNGVLAELSEINDYLQGKSAAIQQAHDYQKKERRLIEKNRLYNDILTQTKPEIELYSRLVEKLAEESEPEKEKSLALRIAFVSAFIKRRDNLIFLSEEEKPIDPSELSHCVEESLSNLRLGGTECYCSSELVNTLGFERISRLYETFYRIIYAIMDGLSSVCVYLLEKDGETVMVMRISCGGDFDVPGIARSIGGGKISAEKEDGEWAVTICV